MLCALGQSGAEARATTEGKGGGEGNRGKWLGEGGGTGGRHVSGGKG